MGLHINFFVVPKLEVRIVNYLQQLVKLLKFFRVLDKSVQVSGSIEYNNPQNTDLAQAVVRRIKPLQQDQGNVDWIESLQTTKFSGGRFTNSFYAGWNLLASHIEKFGETGIGYVAENHFDVGNGDIFDEFHVFYYDAQGNQHRPLSIIMDKNREGNRYSYFKGARHFLMDIRNNNQYFQVETTGNPSQVVLSLFSPESGGSKGVQFFYDESTFNSLQIQPIGTNNTSLGITFPLTYVNNLKVQLSDNPSLHVIGQDTHGVLSKVKFNEEQFVLRDGVLSLKQ